MDKIKNLIKEALLNHKHDCGCGCHGKCAKAPMLNENLGAKVIMTENMQYHIDNKKTHIIKLLIQKLSQKAALIFELNIFINS